MESEHKLCAAVREATKQVGSACNDGVRAPKPGYWYEFDEYYCPQCGSTKIYKGRVYNKPKPKEYEKRHLYKECWCYCGAL